MQIEESRTDFFPLNQARCLNSTLTEKNLDEIQKKVNDIKETVDAIKKDSERHQYTYTV